MKAILRNVLLFTFTLYVTEQMLQGLTVNGGWQTYLYGGIFLAIGFKILKPIITIISLPFQIITLGVFSIVIMALILFIITLIFPAISVNAFIFSGLSYGGIEIHKFYISQLLSYVVISATIYLTTKLIKWLFE